MDNNFNNADMHDNNTINNTQQPAPQYMSYEQMRGSQQPMPADPFEVTYAERANLKKNYFGTFIAVFIHCIGGFIIAQIAFTLMMVMGYEFRYTEDDIAIIDWIYSIAGSLPSILCCLGIFIFDKTVNKIKLRSYFRTGDTSMGMAVGFFGALIFVYSVSIFVQNLMLTGMFSIGISPLAEEYLTEPDLTSAYLICEIIFTVILAPIAEELMYRGVVLRRLSSVNQTFAIFVSAALFGLMHGNLLQTVLGFFMGIVLGYAAVKTGSLLLPIAGHMFINFAASSSTFVQYFIDEQASTTYWSLSIVMFFIVGLITVVALLATGKISFPEYNERHKRRTWPVVVRCVSFWIMIIYLLADVISKFGPATEKLIGE